MARSVSSSSPAGLCLRLCLSAVSLLKSLLFMSPFVSPLFQCLLLRSFFVYFICPSEIISLSSVWTLLHCFYFEFPDLRSFSVFQSLYYLKCLLFSVSPPSGSDVTWCGSNKSYWKTFDIQQTVVVGFSRWDPETLNQGRIYLSF